MLITIVLIAIVSVSGCIGTTAENRLVHYSNGEFTFNYISTWKIGGDLKNTTDNTTTLTLSNNKSNVVSIKTQPFTGDNLSLESINSIIGSLGNISDQGEFTVDKNAGLRCNFNKTVNGAKINGVFIAFTNNQKLYTITFTTLGNTTAIDKDINTIVGSFELLN
jgi:hypothetical protein